MLRLRATVFAAITLLMAAFACAYAAPNYPSLTGRVVDQAGLLTADQVVILTNKLAAIEQSSGHQVAVATVKSLEGQDIAPYANELYRKWALGSKDKSDGVLLLVAPNERKVRIEVGYGLEGDLTDATSSVIINRAIVPKFKAGEYFSGLYTATEDIEKVITGQGAEIIKAANKPKVQKQATFRDALPFIIFFIVVLVILFNASRGRMVFIPMGGGFGGGGGFGSGGSFGGGGGGGFDGGGGSSGGGGASGDW
jgi:uncharacterized protein